MDNSLKDYKGWIQNRAEEIVFRLFVSPFDREWDWETIWERHKDWAYVVATEHYKDAYADMVDATYERIRDERMFNPVNKGGKDNEEQI